MPKVKECAFGAANFNFYQTSQPLETPAKKQSTLMKYEVTKIVEFCCFYMNQWSEATP
jgi:hypothetical protein